MNVHNEKLEILKKMASDGYAAHEDRLDLVLTYHYSRKTSPVHGGDIRLGLGKFKGYCSGKRVAFVWAFDVAAFTKGSGKEGLTLHSQTVQAVSEEYVLKRKQFKKAKLRWRASGGSKRALGWIPFKAAAIGYKRSGIKTDKCTTRESRYRCGIAMACRTMN